MIRCVTLICSPLRRYLRRSVSFGRVKLSKVSLFGRGRTTAFLRWVILFLDGEHIEPVALFFCLTLTPFFLSFFLCCSLMLFVYEVVPHRFRDWVVLIVQKDYVLVLVVCLLFGRGRQFKRRRQWLPVLLLPAFPTIICFAFTRCCIHCYSRTTPLALHLP